MGLLSKILDLLLPPRCIACDRLLPNEARAPLCDACRVAWEAEKRIPCARCLAPTAHCACTPPVARGALSGACALAPYHGEEAPITRAMILRAKEFLHPALRAFLADELSRVVPKTLPKTTVVTYVPRNPRAVRRVGYDQAKELAQSVAQILSLATVDVLCALPQSRAQKQRSRAERIAAAREAYEVCDSIDEVRDRTVLLVDDVLTTGASAAACAALLKENGAQRVYLLTVGKTPLL